MVHLYEKVGRTIDNEYGIREVIEENPFEKGPCIITVLAVTFTLKDINGAIRQVAQLVNPEIDNNYNLDRRVFGLGFGEYDLEKEMFSGFCGGVDQLQAFVKKYFSPLFIKDNQRIECLEAMKNIRNINFVTYCNGTENFKIIEYLLKQEMIRVGYSNDEISLIMSQICLAAISGNVMRKSETSSLTVTFGDIKDRYFRAGIPSSKRKKITDKADYQGFINDGSSIAFTMLGNGNHSFKRHMTGDDILSPMISCFLNTSVDNALENRNSSYFNPITYEKIEQSFDAIDCKRTLLH